MIKAQRRVAHRGGDAVKSARGAPAQQLRFAMQIRADFGERGQHRAADLVDLRAQVFCEIGYLVKPALLGAAPSLEVFALQAFGGVKLRDEKTGA